MHIADGLIDLVILIPLWVIIIAYMVYVVWNSKNVVKEERVPLYGALTAMVFAFQMLNFPILAGTSGHLLGFVVLAIFSTPSIAFLMMTVILTIQAFFFADGGILALSANIFNMGILALVGYMIYWAIRKKLSVSGESTTHPKNQRALLIAAFLGSYFSVLVASVGAGIEIGLSQNFPYPIGITVPTMLVYHLLIGLGEAFITTAIVAFFLKFSPEYIQDIKTIPIWS